MRISELSRRSGVATATIKYYLREGLLPKGEPTSVTQASYDEGHLRRLRLIRALVDVGGLSVATAREVLHVVDEEGLSLHRKLGAATYALGPTITPPIDDPAWKTVREEVDQFLSSLSWQVSPDAPARNLLTHALLSLRHLGYQCDTEHLRAYARAAGAVATTDLKTLAAHTPASESEAVEEAITFTVLYQPVLLALRRLAHEHESALRFADAETTPQKH
jgi:DNA-binding transcriptional MerR regulator